MVVQWFCDRCNDTVGQHCKGAKVFEPDTSKQIGADPRQIDELKHAQAVLPVTECRAATYGLTNNITHKVRKLSCLW